VEPSPQDSRVITVVLSHEKGDVTLVTEAEVDIDKEGFRQGRQCRITFEKYVQARQTDRREIDRQDDITDSSWDRTTYGRDQNRIR
jgi:hypothetical protein